MAKRDGTSPTRRVTRPKTSAPKTARRRALAEDAAAEIAASVAPVENPPVETAAAEAPVEIAAVEPIPAEAPARLEPVAAAPEPTPWPPALVIEPRVSATEDEPTTRVIFRRPPPVPVRPRGWALVRSLIGRLQSELRVRTAPARARIERRFPRVARLRRMLARWA